MPKFQHKPEFDWEEREKLDGEIIYKDEDVTVKHWISGEGGHFICIEHKVSGKKWPESLVLSMAQFRNMAHTTISAIFDLYGEFVPPY